MHCYFYPSIESTVSCDRCNRPVCERKYCYYSLNEIVDPFRGEFAYYDHEYNQDIIKLM